jgi:hypothetical protein
MTVSRSRSWSLGVGEPLAQTAGRSARAPFMKSRIGNDAD